MQRVLTFEIGDRKYVSKPFDFETMCIINDAHNSDERKGPLNICREAVSYMFEGTEATEEVINGLAPSAHARLCLELWSFYAEALSSKKE